MLALDTNTLIYYFKGTGRVADHLKATAPRPLNFTPGEKYAYSNTNYHLLAMIIRKLTGQFYGDFGQVEDAEVVQLLRERRFVVLQGPPGTGKTRLADAILRDQFRERGQTVGHPHRDHARAAAGRAAARRYPPG